MARNRYLSDDHEDFTVSGPESIIDIIRDLGRKNITLCGAFNGGVEVLLTAVLEVLPKEGCVFIDVNANAERNAQFLRSSRVVFYAFAAGAKIQWSCTSIESAEFEGRPAFRIPIPERLQRIQRRNAFRVSTPITHPVLCHIPLAPDHVLTLPLVDICVEGIGVALPAEPDPAFQKNAHFRNCSLAHEDLKIDGLGLAVQNIWDVTLRNGSTCQHAGLEFVDISQKVQPVIQRFVYKMERQRIATLLEQ